MDRGNTMLGTLSRNERDEDTGGRGAPSGETVEVRMSRIDVSWFNTHGTRSIVGDIIRY